jgi:FKBP-type peptidyl-prolyl cis-trans isomerase
MMDRCRLVALLASLACCHAWVQPQALARGAAYQSTTRLQATPDSTRRKVWTSLAGLMLAKPLVAQAADGETTLFKTPSGLKYIELSEGTGPSPRYGQLCTIAYTAYIQLPPNKNNPKPSLEQYDQSTGFLTKHGNGRLLSGLDEGLHTIKVGGQRRIIIPPKLGFVDIGLGPIPDLPWNRSKLNGLLDKMVAVSGGNLVYDVTLLQVLDDEADQGYYEDDSLSPQDFDTLRKNLQEKAAKARQESMI